MFWTLETFLLQSVSGDGKCLFRSIDLFLGNNEY